MRVPKFIRYFLYRSRLMKMMVSFDIIEKERILNSYFYSKLREFDSVVTDSSISILENDLYIRFTISKCDYDKSADFRNFELIGKELCKRFGYNLTAGSTHCYDDDVKYWYSVYPTGLTYRVKTTITRAFSPHAYDKDIELYYSKLK